ncbi:MAG: methionine ABC transporter [Desulfuromonas sp.]|nr:MAG: methionine ABC transporter [Desulfuromonas sp.]
MVTKRLLFFFPRCETEKPIVYHLVKDFDLEINIFRAKVTPDEEGYLVLDLTGNEANIDKGIAWLVGFGVEVREQDKGLRWDQERCVSCGNCIPHCPTKALRFEEDKRTLGFDGAKCIVCLNCIPNCPYGACSSMF